MPADIFSSLLSNRLQTLIFYIFAFQTKMLQTQKNRRNRKKGGTMNIEEIIKQPEYGFLFSEERLGDNIMLLAFGGSHAYGTNRPGSDIDIRGITAPRRKDILNTALYDRPSDKHNIMGTRGFEQYNDPETDTIIYSLDKMVRLLYKCNPNTIEILGCRPQDYTMVSDAGKLLLENSDAFLSKFAYGSFSGYARQQLFRLKNALARDSLSKAERSVHMIDTVERMYRHLEEVYSTFKRDFVEFYLTDLDGNRIAVAGNAVTLGDIEFVYTGDTWNKMTASGKVVDPESVEMRADIRINDIRLDDLAGVYSEVSSVIRDYNAHKGHRNNKKDEAHLNKHAMHLVRLYLMCTDILKDHRIVTYREKEHDMLMAIRDGAYMKPDGTYDRKFFGMIDTYERQLRDMYEKTTLPDTPDEKRIADIVTDIKESVLNK